jgi:hypothetical protein
MVSDVKMCNAKVKNSLKGFLTVFLMDALRSYTCYWPTILLKMCRMTVIRITVREPVLQGQEEAEVLQAQEEVEVLQAQEEVEVLQGQEEAEVLQESVLQGQEAQKHKGPC